MGNDGLALIDSNGKKIITNYERYLPDLSLLETWTAFLFIFIGIAILILLDWYGKNRRLSD